MSAAQMRAANVALSLRGSTAVVVGGTSGIGHGIALTLAQANAAVTIVGRDETRGAEIVQEMSQRATPGPDGEKPQFQFLRCDATSLSGIKSFAAEFASRHPRLDILVMTQGIATLDGYTPTKEGLDRKLAIHHYGRVAFAKCFAPFMQTTSSAPQVLSVLSAGVHAPYQNYRADPELKESYSIKNAADAAGFYNDIATEELSKEYPSVRFIHSAPGIVNTTLGSEFPFYIRYPVRGLLGLIGQSIEDCGAIQCRTLLSYANEGKASGGFMLMSPKGEEARKTSLHDEAKEIVWQHTKSILKNVAGIE